MKSGREGSRAKCVTCQVKNLLTLCDRFLTWVTSWRILQAALNGVSSGMSGGGQNPKSSDNRWEKKETKISICSR